MSKKQITAEALRYWLKKSGFTQTALAQKTGLSQNYISQINNGARDGSIDAIDSIAGAFGVSLPEFFACKDGSLPDIEFVPLVKAVPRAGSGGLEVDGDHIGYYSFHSSFLLRKGGSVESMRLFKIEGDSMEPTLISGDMILINTSPAACHVRTGGVYLLRLGEELMVKRLETRPGGVLLIRSDNRAYESIPVNMVESEGEVEVFGRMVWSCREY